MNYEYYPPTHRSSAHLKLILTNRSWLEAQKASSWSPELEPWQDSIQKFA